MGLTSLYETYVRTACSAGIAFLDDRSTMMLEAIAVGLHRAKGCGEIGSAPHGSPRGNAGVVLTRRLSLEWSSSRAH